MLSLLKRKNSRGHEHQPIGLTALPGAEEIKVMAEADARAQQEFATFERLRQNQVDKTNKQNTEVQQFVYTMRNPGDATTRASEASAPAIPDTAR